MYQNLHYLKKYNAGFTLCSRSPRSPRLAKTYWNLELLFIFFTLNKFCYVLTSYVTIYHGDHGDRIRTALRIEVLRPGASKLIQGPLRLGQGLPSSATNAITFPQVPLSSFKFSHVHHVLFKFPQVPQVLIGFMKA